MKTLYLSCEMGAAGDMLMAALYELLPDKQAFLDTMNGLLPGLTITPEPSEKCGIRGTHMAVAFHGEEENEEFFAHIHEHAHAHAHDYEHTHDHDHEHAHDHDHAHHHDHTHGSLAEIELIIAHLPLPEAVRADTKKVYQSIAEAESRVHGVPVTQVHFHEVGAVDAVADVAGVCLLMHLLAPEQVLASPVHVGSGQVRCAHGLLPVPAPATALLLEGMPIYGGTVQGELCTPTGAALLKHFVTRFCPMPVMTLEKTGYGMGKKDFEAANCVRALLGNTQDGAEDVLELRCNLDDMSPEALGFAQEQLWKAGALDVYTAPLGMKKNRPGVLLVTLCRAAQREALLQLIFRHTTTLGVREVSCRRSTLRRREEIAKTRCGEVRIKVSEGWGVVRKKAEYEDLARIAREQGMTIEEVRSLLK
ncbi:MAG: nickel pincer cofactor biosynthesis protein LarC [Selenomonadaceae bacterium]|nr:nickel pincer cofactor biosynthesis protein LarC [Selenomonadaceae bacterium]